MTRPDRAARQLLMLGCSSCALSLSTPAVTWAAVAAAQQAVSPALSSATPADATASSQSANAPAAVGEIVVTAQKRQESLKNVPMSVTAVTGKQLVEKGIFGVQDLVKVTPGLSYVDSGRGVPVFSLRGVGFFDQALGARPTVSVYVDEAPLAFSIMAAGSAFDLERVEVLKGPQGTLFGQNATGGAINYIAAKPTNGFAAGATASYGSFNTFDLQGYVSGPITPTLNARLAVRTLQSGDWQKSYTRSDSLGSQDFTQARLLLDWRPTDQLKVTFNLNGFHDGSDTQAPQFEAVRAARPSIALLTAYPPAPNDDRAADWDPNRDYAANNLFSQASLRVDYKVSPDLTITSLTSYSQERVNQRSEGDGTTLTNYEPHVRGKLSSFSEELRASGDIGRLDYIAGLNYESAKTAERNEFLQPYSNTGLTTIPGGPPLDQFGVVNNQDFDTKAVFANLTYHLIDHLALRGGVRYTEADLDYSGCSYGPDANAAAVFTILDNRTRAGLGKPALPPFQIGQCFTLNLAGDPVLATGSLNESNVAWRVGMDYKMNPDTLLYLNVSKGYKAGSSPNPAASSTVQFNPVKQESVLAYEGGFKTSLFDKRLELTGAGFYYDYADKQLLGRQVFTPNIFGALSALVNIPKSEVLGAEFQATVYPIKGLTLSAAATYLKTKVIGDFFNYSILGVQTNFNGSPFPYTPDWQLVFDGEYKFPLNENFRGIIGGNASYRTSTTAGFGGNSLLNIDDYWLVDARVGAETADGKWRVLLFGRNITDQYYWTNVVSAVDNVRRYAGRPATFGVQVSYRY